jgi:predicted ester cyclase
MTESERDLGRRWFELVWNQGKREAIAEMLSPNALIHDSGTDTRGPDGFYVFFDRMRTVFSDLHVTFEDSITEADRICVRWLFTAKHTGHGIGVDPTGKNVRVTGISILRVANGQLVEGWQNWDMLGLLQQIQGSANTTNNSTYIAER